MGKVHGNVINVSERVPYHVTRNVDNWVRAAFPCDVSRANSFRRAEYETQTVVRVQQIPLCANRESAFNETRTFDPNS
jgi:hypothetical protein